MIVADFRIIKKILVFYRSRYWKNHKKSLMTNDLNGHEQWRTYGVHLYVTYEVHLHVTHWGTLICHSLRGKELGYLFY